MTTDSKKARKERDQKLGTLEKELTEEANSLCKELDIWQEKFLHSDNEEAAIALVKEMVEKIDAFQQKRNALNTIFEEPNVCCPQARYFYVRNAFYLFYAVHFLIASLAKRYEGKNSAYIKEHFLDFIARWCATFKEIDLDRINRIMNNCKRGTFSAPTEEQNTIFSFIQQGCKAHVKFLSVAGPLGKIKKTLNRTASIIDSYKRLIAVPLEAQVEDAVTSFSPSSGCSASENLSGTKQQAETSVAIPEITKQTDLMVAAVREAIRAGKAPLVVAPAVAAERSASSGVASSVSSTHSIFASLNGKRKHAGGDTPDNTPRVGKQSRTVEAMDIARTASEETAQAAIAPPLAAAENTTTIFTLRQAYQASKEAVRAAQKAEEEAKKKLLEAMSTLIPALQTHIQNQDAQIEKQKQATATIEAEIAAQEIEIEKTKERAAKSASILQRQEVAASTARAEAQSRKDEEMYEAMKKDLEKKDEVMSEVEQQSIQP